MSSFGTRLQLATKFLLSFGYMFTVTKCMFAHVTVVVSLLYLFHLLSLVLLAPLCDIRLFLCTRGLLPVGPAPRGACSSWDLLLMGPAPREAHSP